VFFKILSYFSIFLAGIELVILGLGIVYGGKYFSSPVDQVMPADVIVVLGGGTADRLSKGIDLYKQGLAEKLLVTGFPSLKPDAMLSYIDWRIMYLTNAGISRESLVLDGTARSSVEEAVVVREYLTINKMGTAIIVSDPPHIRRLSFIFSSTFQLNDELSYRLVASEPVWWKPEKWWENTVSAQFVILEAIKFLYFGFNKLSNEGV